MSDQHVEIVKLDNIIASFWNDLFKSSQSEYVKKAIDKKDVRLYCIYLIQLYHWSSWAARCLGLAGANPYNRNDSLMTHYFDHAKEETGHEKMALNDLQNIGITINDPKKDLPKPLPTTEALVAYVKYLAGCDQPYKMLGYDYWSEKPYKYINHFIYSIKDAMNLKNDQMTFYMQHKKIDEKHGADVENIMLNVCKLDEEWEAVRETAYTSLNLAGLMIMQIIEEYKKLAEGKSSKYEFLNELL
jgi:hypothetical protein